MNQSRYVGEEMVCAMYPAPLFKFRA